MDNRKIHIDSWAFVNGPVSLSIYIHGLTLISYSFSGEKPGLSGDTNLDGGYGGAETKRVFGLRQRLG